MTVVEQALRRSLPTSHRPTPAAARAGWCKVQPTTSRWRSGSVPFAVAAHVAANNPDDLRWVVSGTRLFSFAHQPRTLWLVYRDERQRRADRALFTWAPEMAPATVAAGTAVQAGVYELFEPRSRVGRRHLGRAQATTTSECH